MTDAEVLEVFSYITKKAASDGFDPKLASTKLQLFDYLIREIIEGTLVDELRDATTRRRFIQTKRREELLDAKTRLTAELDKLNSELSISNEGS